MYNSKFLKISIHLVYFSLLIFIGFIIISAMFYPGTTIRDHDTVGYNIFYNFLSDLGRTITHYCNTSSNICDTCIGGNNNFFSAFFFNNAMFICGIFFIVFYIALPGYFYEDQTSYRFSILFCTNLIRQLAQENFFLALQRAGKRESLCEANIPTKQT